MLYVYQSSIRENATEICIFSGRPVLQMLSKCFFELINAQELVYRDDSLHCSDGDRVLKYKYYILINIY